MVDLGIPSAPPPTLHPRRKTRQLKEKILPLTVTSVFQTFFFHAAWYCTAFFIMSNELQGHKILGLLLAFAGMIIMSL